MKVEPENGGRGVCDIPVRGDWDIEEVVKQNAELMKTNWWADIDTDRVPFAPRPKGGKRIDFYGYGNLPDMALEIKEAYRGFKHTGDVHRTAHYIGIYILRKKYVKNQEEDVLDTFMLAAEDEIKRGAKRVQMLERFKSCYDQFINSLLTKDEFQAVHQKMKDSIAQESDQKWFIHCTDAIMGDEEELLKSKNRQRMQRIRADLKGIREVEKSSESGG